MTPSEQAARYLAAIPGAVSGSGGHSQTFSAACSLVHGFALQESEALHLLSGWNRSCKPPWSEHELIHKIESAASSSHSKPRGHLLSPTTDRRIGKSPAPRKPAPKAAAPAYVIDEDEAWLPDPIPDGTRELLRAAFRDGECVRIVPAKLNDDGKEIPENEGPCLPRAEWLRRLDAVGGDPNGIFKKPAPQPGIYISINPLKGGGSRDADVTDYRHVLVEFDDLSIAGQWNLYEKSNLPCTAIIHSGKKSIHAWVRVDAANRDDYDERVALIYEHFATYGLDNKNKNPSRLSRLPNCIRLDVRQELLALNFGAKSYTEWSAKIMAEGIGKRISIRSLIEFDPDKDKACLIGQRWACKGGSILWVGQSGIGKSSMTMQAAVTWALGRPLFGVAPARPLKSMIVQAENDVGDTAEMFTGVLAGLGLSAFSDELTELEDRIVIIRDTSHTGQPFTAAVGRLIDLHKPDLVWLDPLLSFIGDDISKQEVCGKFLRNWLNPIGDATGVCWMMVHHSGKPSADPKIRAQSGSDSYYGIGSSELTNWARGVVNIKLITDGTYALTFAKRGRRAKATLPDGEVTETVHIAHSKTGICWDQVSVAPPDKTPKPSGRPDKVHAIVGSGNGDAGIGLGPFIDDCPPEGEGLNAIAKRLEMFVAKLKCDASLSVCKKAISILFERGAIVKSDSGKYAKP